MAQDMAGNRERMRRETLAKAISTPVGREILKVVLRRHLRPEVAGPLCDTVDGKLSPEIDGVRDAIEDAVLDSLSAGKIQLSEVTELFSCLKGTEERHGEE